MNIEESHKLSQDFFNLSYDPSGVLSKDFILLKANPVLLKLCGIESELLKTTSFKNLLHPDDQEIIQTNLSYLQTGTPAVFFESRLLTKTNTLQWYSWQVVSDQNTGNYYFSGADITKHKITLSVLEEHTDKLLKIIELVPHPIFLKDSNARYILVNQAQADLFSSTKKDFIGRDDSYFLKTEEELQGVRTSDDIVLNKKKNIILPEQTITHPNGNQKILHTSKIPFLSSFSGEVNILGVSIDITEIKHSENELRKINFELDSFVYHASHDLRAPLCSLEGLFNLIKNETQEEIRTRCVEEGLKSIKRLDGFISDLTDLSRNNRTIISPDCIKFKKIIKRTLTNLKYIKNADRITVSVEIDKKIDFFSDKHRMKIIFMNLISNAIKYQSEDKSDPSLTISIKCNESFAEIAFRDNGIGIEEKYKSKVFDMFFRGTILATGSGLGLYIVKEVVSKLEGKLELISEENVGTTVTLRIPNLIENINTLSKNNSEEL
jgi:PAS domain S-box-containing protein